MMYRIQDLEEDKIRQSSHHHAMYGSAGTVDNLDWNYNQILGLCEDGFLNKILWMEDVPGESAETIVVYLKGGYFC